MEEWAKIRWNIELVPDLSDDKQPPSVEKLRKQAKDNGILIEFDQIREFAKRLGLGEKANQRCISYKPPYNWQLVTMTVYPYSGLDITLNLNHFPKYKNVQSERIQEIFWNRKRWWLTRENSNEFFSC
jgi:hypothetical protein